MRRFYFGYPRIPSPDPTFPMASSSAASAGQSGPGKHRAGRKVRLRQLMARLRSGDLPEWVSGDDVFQLFSRYAPEALQAQTLGEWPMSTTLEFPLLQPAASTLRGTHQASQASEMPAVQYRPIWQRGSSGQITGRRLSMACCSPDGRPRGDWPVIGQPSRGGPSRQFQLIRSTARQANSLQDLRPRGQQAEKERQRDLPRRSRGLQEPRRHKGRSVGKIIGQPRPNPDLAGAWIHLPMSTLPGPRAMRGRPDPRQ